MPTGDYLEGLFFGVATLALILGGAVLFIRRRHGEYVGAQRLVAVGVVATLAMLATHLIPAALTVLSRGTVLGAELLWLVIVLALPARERAPDPAPEPEAKPGTAARVLAAGSALLLATLAVAIARDQLLLAPAGIDALNFHLPGVARWIQLGSIWQIDVFLPQVFPGHYPQNGDVAFLAAVLPWRNDFLVHYAMYPFWAGTGVAIYALSRELRASREAAIAAACLVLAIPAVAIPALVGVLVDATMLFGFSASLLFLVRQDRTGSSSDLVFAGLAMGIAFGAKWYGVSSAAIVIGVRAVAGLLAGRDWRAVARQAVALTGLTLLAGGLWLLRNLVESGNPVMPVKVAPFGIEVFDAPRDTVRERAGDTLAGRIDQPDLWIDSILPQLRDALALSALVLVAAGVAAAVVLIRRRRRGNTTPLAGVVGAGLAAALLLAIAYSVTPYTAGGSAEITHLVGVSARYAVPALIPLAAIAAWAAGRAGWGPVLLGVAALAAVLDGIRLVTTIELGGAAPGFGDWLFAIAGVGGIALVVAVAPRLRARLSGSGPRLAAAVASVAAVAAVVLVGDEIQQRYNERRYVGAETATDPLTAPGPARRVGIAGIWGNDYSAVYPAFGPRLENDVEYVGRFDGDVIRRYATQEAFADALADGDYDLVAVGRFRPGEGTAPELAWAREAGFETVAESERFSLLAPPEPP